MKLLSKLFGNLFDTSAGRTPTEKWYFEEGGKALFEEKIKKYRRLGVEEILISNFHFLPRKVEFKELRGLLAVICPAVYLDYTDLPGQDDVLLLINQEPVITRKGGAYHE